MVGSGKMGEGKSNLMQQILKKASEYNKMEFNFNDNMTYSRKELKVWIDGDSKGLGQKPERSPILADELISMFFKRNWYDTEQIDGIELLNKCRDRHLIVAGNIPNFMSLDSAIYPLITFWIHVKERGRAWIFQPDENPFVSDQWHIKENAKIYSKYKNPYSCVGFVGEIIFDDFDPQDKEDYYRVRNEKRKGSEGQRDKAEKYRDIKEQRNTLIRYILKSDKKITLKTLAELTDLSSETIRSIKEGIL